MLLLLLQDWLSIVNSKQAAFGAVAELHQALVCQAKKDVGEELARLGHAMELMKTAEARAGVAFSFRDDAKKIARIYEETKKDNDFIYHARVPEVKSLAPIGKAVLAKPLPVPDKFSASGQGECFLRSAQLLSPDSLRCCHKVVPYSQ